MGAPFASAELRRRLVRDAASLDELTALLERKGAAKAERVAGGVALARGAGWQAEPIARRSYGGAGLEIARLAEELRPTAVVVGYDGSDGARCALAAAASVLAARKPIAVAVGDGCASPHRRRGRGRGRRDGPARGRPAGAGRAGRRRCARRFCRRARRRAHRRRLPRGLRVGAILLGSVAMAVLHHAERPVLTVPGADRLAGH
jgi:nucleotide-binding universal stress UspA family protein